jgi:hypothetical protein
MKPSWINGQAIMGRDAQSLGSTLRKTHPIRIRNRAWLEVLQQR